MDFWNSDKLYIFQFIIKWQIIGKLFMQTFEYKMFFDYKSQKLFKI